MADRAGETPGKKPYPFFVWGINHKTAPLDVRGKFFISKDRLPGITHELCAQTGASEGVLLCTCNRIEYYAAGEYLQRHELSRFWTQRTNLSSEHLALYAYSHEEHSVVRHLFEVSAGLDSLVLGETQILSQIKEAYEHAQRGKTIGPLLNVLFQKALQIAKQVHTQTRLASFHASVPSVALEFSEKIFDSFTDKRILVIGTGEIGWLTIHLLHKKGIRNITVVSKSVERVREWERRFSLPVSLLSDMIPYLSQFDIVLSCTQSDRRFVLTGDHLHQTLLERRFHPLLLLDLSVPRTLDPTLGKLENVFLYNIDDLQSIVQQNFQERQKEAQKAHSLISEAVHAFYQEQEWSEFARLITEFREKARSHPKAFLEQILKDSLQDISPGIKNHSGVTSLFTQTEGSQTTLFTILCEEPLGALKEKWPSYPAGYELLQRLNQRLQSAP